MTLRVAIASGLCLALVQDLASGGAREARAQVNPSPLQPTGGEPTPPKKEGVAEQAESAPEALPTTPVLPPIQDERKRFELFELDGYFRLRTNWFKNCHLGYDDDVLGGAPFPRPLSCPADAGCGDDTLQSVDMRLRLEPTINIGETAKVHLQMDALDNVVLGSTRVTRAAPGSGAPGSGVAPFPQATVDGLRTLGYTVGAPADIGSVQAVLESAAGQRGGGAEPDRPGKKKAASAACWWTVLAVPLSLIVSGANRHDVKLLAITLDSIVVVRPKASRRRRQHLCADKGYAGRPAAQAMQARGYTPHVRQRGEEALACRQGQRARRWVVERTHSWFNRFRKLLVRYEKTAANFLALLQCAAALICWRMC